MRNVNFFSKTEKRETWHKIPRISETVRPKTALDFYLKIRKNSFNREKFNQFFGCFLQKTKLIKKFTSQKHKHLKSK